MGAGVKRYWPKLGAARTAVRRWGGTTKYVLDALTLSALQSGSSLLARSRAESVSLAAAQTVSIGGGPTATSASINTAGTQLTVAFSENIQQGADTNVPVPTLSGGACTLTYASGAGTNQRVFTTSRTVSAGETGTLAYTQLGDGYKAVDDSALVATFSGLSITNNSTAGTPTLSSATVASDGASISLVFSQSVSIGAGGNGGFTLNMSGGASTMTYSSGSGSTTLVYTLSRTVNSGETGDLDYTQPGNGVEATSGGGDVVTFADASVSNSSTAGPPTLSSATIQSSGDTINLVFSKSVTVGAGGNGGFVATMSGGAVTMTYSSGSGSTTLVYSLSRTIGEAETGTLAYTQPGDGIEATTGGDDLASFSGTTILNGAGAFLTWTAVTGAAGYKVYWSTTPFGYMNAELVAAGTVAGVEDLGNVTSAAQGDFTGIGTGTRYFQARSYDDSGMEGPWDDSKQITVVVS